MRSGHRNVLSFMARDGCGIFDGDHFLVLVRHENRLLAALDTLLRALRVRGIRAFRCALGVADPSIPVCAVRSSHCEHAAQKQSKHHHGCLLHAAPFRPCSGCDTVAFQTCQMLRYDAQTKGLRFTEMAAH